MATTKTARADIDHIQETLALLFQPGQVFEIRAPGYKGRGNNTASGYFDDQEAAARHAAVMSGQAPAIYCTLNPVNPDLLARAANRIAEYAKATTSDADIVRLRWLPVDFDPVRPSGISSSDEEHAAALQRARQVRADLREAGWPEPILADSGNGAHLLYRLDLAPTPDNVTRIRQVLAALADSYDDAAVKLDRTVFNPARIWKVYGTVAAKGDDTATRPHRLAAIVEYDELDRDVLTVAQIDELAALAPPDDAVQHGAAQDGDPVFDLAAFVDCHSDVLQPRRVGTAEKWRVTCPWNEAHAGDAVIGRMASGAIWAKCSHNSCSWNWHDLRERLEPAPELVFDHKPQAPATNGAAKRAAVVEVEPEPDDEEPDVNPLDGAAVDLRKLSLGWIGDYADLAADITNSPYEFNVLNALVGLAAAIGGNAYLPFMNNLRPNLYGMIVAPSTVFHKSTTLFLIQDLLARTVASARLLPNDFSYEGLLSKLAEMSKDDAGNPVLPAAGLVVQSEVSAILDSHQRKYLMPLKTSLTDLYDGQRVHRMLTRGEYIIPAPALSILGATTLDKFHAAATDADWGSGFLVRWLYVAPESEPEYERPLRRRTADVERKLNTYADRLRDATQHECTEFQIDPAALQMWNQYQATENRRAYEAGDDRTMAVVGRYNTVALKLAIILADVTDTWGDITPAAMVTALALTDYFKRSLLRLSNQSREQAVTNGALQTVLVAINSMNRKGTKPSINEVRRALGQKARTTQRLVEELHRRGAVIAVSRSRTTGYVAVVDKLPIGRGDN